MGKYSYCHFCGAKDAAEAGYGKKAAPISITYLQILGNKLRSFCDKKCRDAWVAMRPGVDKVWD